MIKYNITEVQNNIVNACKRCNRDPSEVTLIAVSKTKPLSMLEEAHIAGMTEFGENKVQEICEKAEALKDPTYHFHMIGHLQTNKVKKVIPHVSCIHSIDSKHLAEYVSKESQKIGKCTDILLEVNIAQEDSKFGLDEVTVIDLVTYCSTLDGLHVRGLMTVAPYTDNPEDNRVYFRKMRELKNQINDLNLPNINLDMLSMGMSGDYEVAIEEGATHVRVGTKIFGERNYNI